MVGGKRREALRAILSAGTAASRAGRSRALPLYGRSAGGKALRPHLRWRPRTGGAAASLERGCVLLAAAGARPPAAWHPVLGADRSVP